MNVHVVLNLGPAISPITPSETTSLHMEPRGIRVAGVVWQISRMGGRTGDLLKDESEETRYVASEAASTMDT